MQNNSFSISFLVILALGITLAIPFTLLWFWIIKKGWASVRILALWCGLLIISVGAILWLQVRETWLIISTLVCGLLAGLMVLTWPVTAPQIIKRLNLKW